MTRRPKARPTLAISIRQPYVEAILRGIKKKEFRSRPTHVRGVVYLYASRKDGDYDSYRRQIKAAPGDLPTGLIVGTVEITDCVYMEKDDGFGWVLKNPRRLRLPLRPVNQPQPVFWRPTFR